MTKADIVSNIVEETGLERVEALKAVEAFMTTIKASLSNGKNVETTEKDLKKVFPRDTWIRRHLQIIFFGREHCPARNHNLNQCLICGWASTKKRIREEMN